MADRNASKGKHRVALALQGGGSHGAFTWGVLDRILQEPDIEIIGVTGTSAGGCNAVVLADGLLRGGPERARAELRQFWESVGNAMGFGSLISFMSGQAAGEMPLEQTFAYSMWDMVSRNLSPYDLNPLQWNPLRDLLEAVVDIELLRSQTDFPVMVCATNARTARRRVFANHDLSIDAVLASACLPTIFPAIMIDGDPYWDGGFTGNPAFAALIRRLPKCDMLIVRIDPVYREAVPRTPREIADRVTEIGFNSCFWLELAAIGQILRFVDEGLLERERFGRILFHAIEASALIEKFPHSSKINNHAGFIQHLFELGSETADKWIAKNGDHLGERSTIDLQKLLPVEMDVVPGWQKDSKSAEAPVSPALTMA
jgi:NTE family protein